VVAQCSPNATKAHIKMWRHATHRTLQRLTLFSSRSRTKQDATIHYGTLEGGHRTRTSLGQSPQLNCRLPRIATKAPQRLGNLHNLIGGPKYMPQRPLSRLGFQEPKSNKRRERDQSLKVQQCRSRSRSLRGEVDWWKRRSRSPLSFPSRFSKNHGRGRERDQSLKVQQCRRERNGSHHPKEEEGGLL
jgi:hypothetical protein